MTTTTDLTRSWDLLTSVVEDFIEAWDAAPPPPDVADFLPPPEDFHRRPVLVELLKIDLEYRWATREDCRRVDDYIGDFPELSSESLPCDLIYEEFHVRKQAGDSVRPEEYFERFPARAAELRKLMPVGGEATRSTGVRPARRLADINPGDTLDEFELLSALGEGTFAKVFLALQRSFPRTVALKVSADRGRRPQEAGILSRLDHPHVVRVFDQRVLADRGLWLILMEVVPGGGLNGLIGRAFHLPPAGRSGATVLGFVDDCLAKRDERPPAESETRRRLAELTWPQAVAWIGARLADALAYAAGRGVLHRDVKPANVLMTATGSPKLVDFNVSFDAGGVGADAAAFFGGSLAYMSPEQVEAFDPAHDRRPADLDTRSDIYSLAVVLWEMLTGDRPFADDWLADFGPAALRALARQRRAGVPEGEFAKLPADVPPGLADALRKSLAADPDGRFADAAALSRRLDLCHRPETQALLYPPAGSWRAWAARRPLLALVAAALVPNIITAAFNLAYNHSEIIAAELGESPGVFWAVQAVINATAFPAGVAAFVTLCLPACRPLRDGPAAAGAASRRRCVRLGEGVALVCLVAWLLAGVAYPVGLWAAAGGMSPSMFLHFVVSLALCGLMAVAYSFFLVTYVAVRGLLGPLARLGDIAPGEADELSRLDRVTYWYLILAAAVPMASITTLVLTESRSEFALGVLSLGGLIGFGVVSWLGRSIRQALAAAGPALGKA